MNRFGYNYLNVPDVTEEMRHAHAIDAGGGLFFQNQIDFARRFKSERPQSNVVIRNWPDRGVPNSVDEWLKANLPLAEGGLILQVNNEVGLTDKNIQFHEALLERIKRDKIKANIGLFATSVGTPDPDHDWPRAERVLQLADDVYDQVHMIHHEYFGGVVTSGFNGGDPTMIQPETWPRDTRGLTLWHLGRYRFLKRYLASKGRPMLRTIIGENGADFTSDIGKWLATLKSTKGQYDIVDGWRDLFDQWRIWWPQKDAATAYMDQLAYEDQYIYIDKEVETILLFCRWNDGSWGTYQVNPELDQKMEAYAASLVAQPPTTYPKLPDVNDPRWAKVIAKPKFDGSVNVRTQPDKGSDIISRILAGDELYIVASEAAGIWMPVKLPNAGPLRGWVSTDVISFQDAPTQPPNPTITITREEALVLAGRCRVAAENLTALETQSAATRKQLSDLADYWLGIANRS